MTEHTDLIAEARMWPCEMGEGVVMNGLADALEAAVKRADEAEAITVELLADTEHLIEALARLETLDTILGDPGGHRHPKDYWEVVRLQRWVAPLAQDPPNWGMENEDPLTERSYELEGPIRDRVAILRAAIMREDLAYQERVRALAVIRGGNTNE